MFHSLFRPFLNIIKNSYSTFNNLKKNNVPTIVYKVEIETLTLVTDSNGSAVSGLCSNSAVPVSNDSTFARLSLFWSDLSVVVMTSAVRLSIATATVASVIFTCLWKGSKSVSQYEH